MSRSVEHDGRSTFRIRFSYDRRLVDLVKTLPNRRWNPGEKFWTVPDHDVVGLVDLLHQEGFGFDDETRRLYEASGGTLALAGAAPAVAGDAPPRLFDAPDNRAASDDFTVGRLNREVQAAIARAFPGSIWLVGEISGFNKSAHKRIVGFKLVERDAQGQPVSEVNATLFDDARRRIERELSAASDPFRLEDEIEVRCLVRVELYEPWGQYRVRVEELDIQYTLGEAARRREEIVRRLTEEGLHDRNTSLPFPVLPLEVGLVTSLGSDAFNDVMRTFQESGFAFRVTAHGARVQGRQTEPSVLNAMDWFRERKDDFDVLMICRGGGSRTDLTWFDSEALGRAVALFPLPVVIGIGHEQDHSVLDHVGWRCKTPTAAASFLVDKVSQALTRTEDSVRLILETARSLIGTAALELSQRALGIPRASVRLLEGRRVTLEQSVRQLVQGARRDLDSSRRKVLDLAGTLEPRSRRRLALEAERTATRERRLELVHPRRVLERGYSVLRIPDGPVVTDAADAPAGTRVEATLKTGTLRLRSEGE